MDGALVGAGSLWPSARQSNALQSIRTEQRQLAVQGGHDFGSSEYSTWEQLNSSSTASSVASSGRQKQRCSLKFHSHGVRDICARS
jgi:hypothetical protein